MDQEVKNISSDAEKKPEQVAKYTAKDSVFTSLFREPKYLLQLYQALHPEDHEATEDSIKNVTITNVLLDQYGSRQEEEEIAHNLYRILRSLDASGVDIIYAESFETPQIGQAIRNRLLKAAGHQVMKVK